MFKAIRRWLLQRQITKDEGDLAYFKSLQPGHKLYADAQPLIPLMEKAIKDNMKKLTESRR